VIMMLSQTFYRKKPTDGDSKPQKENGDGDGEKTGTISVPSVDSVGSGSDTEIDEAENTGRGTKARQYLKDVLTPHPIWNDGKFWEQVLWECALEQLQTIPYEVPWHDMSTEDRREAHSMLELGCSQRLVREFIYRMCVIHQLSESQKHVLLTHLQSATTVTEE
jgi:hypothetical protein